MQKGFAKGDEILINSIPEAMAETNLVCSSVNVASTYIFLFIAFGEVMNKCGMGQFFNDFANAIAGGTKGGPAKVAVVASGLLGMINGAAVAVVVTTGSFTIPLMKKSG
mgnify:FL=1